LNNCTDTGPNASLGPVGFSPGKRAGGIILCLLLHVMTGLIEKYFPGISTGQLARFEQMETLYKEWNIKINVISRKDIHNLMLHHVLHSLAIARFFTFQGGAKILDVGTGGGFPGIPLAVVFPEVHFTLVDSVGKKIRVVNDIAAKLKLSNVTALQMRAEENRSRFDFIVSRAVTELPAFCQLFKPRLNHLSLHGFKNGILYLKGGDFADQLQLISNGLKVFNLSDVFEESYFITKKLVYIF